MVFNQTCNWLRQERANNKRIEGAKEITCDENFDTFFEYFWQKATEKRKEKLRC